MNIAICFDKNYQRWATVCLHSIWDQHKDSTRIRLVILSDIKFEQCIWQLKSVLVHFDFSFDNPGDDFDSMPTGFHFKTPVYWRLKLPNVLVNYGIKRAIYIDLDTLVINPLDSLFEQDLQNMSVGACLDICSEDNCNRLNLKQGFSINSGLLLMDVEKMNRINWVDEANRLNKEGLIRWVDQDVINILLDQEIKLVDVMWNVQSGNFQNRYNGPVIIIHFTESGDSKPWSIKSKHQYLDVYNTYMRKSGFYFDYLWFETFRRILKLGIFS